MDKKTIQSKKKHNHPPITDCDNCDDTSDSVSQPSRFSRRRFIQAGITASPLLMTVKTPVAWGAETCTVSILASGNLSREACDDVNGLSPGAFHIIFEKD